MSKRAKQRSVTGASTFETAMPRFGSEVSLSVLGGYPPTPRGPGEPADPERASDEEPPPPAKVGAFRAARVFAFDVLEGFSAISMEVWVFECPGMFTELGVVGVLDLVGEGDISKHAWI